MYTYIYKYTVLVYAVLSHKASQALQPLHVLLSHVRSNRPWFKRQKEQVVAKQQKLVEKCAGFLTWHKILLVSKVKSSSPPICDPSKLRFLVSLALLRRTYIAPKLFSLPDHMLVVVVVVEHRWFTQNVMQVPSVSWYSSFFSSSSPEVMFFLLCPDSYCLILSPIFSFLF
jgi:hypothetical protein